MKGYILKKHDEGCVFYAAEKGRGSKIGTWDYGYAQWVP